MSNETNMNIYLFKPSELWNYCGGGAAVIAETFDEAKELFMHYPVAEGVSAVYQYELEGSESIIDGVWILVEVFPLSGFYEPHVVFTNANYA